MNNRLKIFAAALVGVALVAAPPVAANWYHVQNDQHAADVWLGIQSQSVDYDIAEAFDLEVPYGVIVNAVIADSPADKAGLHEGDVILAVNSHSVTDKYELEDALLHLEAGDAATLQVSRDGRDMSITVEVEKRPNRTMRLGNDGRIVMVSPDGSSYTVANNWSNTRRAYLGVQLSDLSDQLAGYFNAEDGGALVTEVKEDSPAERAGLMAGDIIVKVADEQIFEADDVTDVMLDHQKGEEVTVDVLRRGQRQSIAVTLDEIEAGNFFFNQFNPRDVRVEIPDIDLDLPRLNRSFWSEDTRREFNKELREELRESQREVREELRKANEEVRRAMEEMKRELEEIERKLE